MNLLYMEKNSGGEEWLIYFFSPLGGGGGVLAFKWDLEGNKRHTFPTSQQNHLSIPGAL